MGTAGLGFLGAKTKAAADVERTYVGLLVGCFLGAVDDGDFIKGFTGSGL